MQIRNDMDYTFTPEIRLVAVDATDALLLFDTAASHDHARAPSAQRIPRRFASLVVAIDGFTDPPVNTTGATQEFRGTINIVVTGADGTAVSHPVASPVLAIRGTVRTRWGRPAYDFPPAGEVVLAIRQGVASALAGALEEFADQEARVVTLGLAAGGGGESGDAKTTAAFSWASGGASGAPLSRPTRESWLGTLPLSGARRAGRATSTGWRSSRRQIVLAAVITPVVVYGLLALGGAMARKSDPIQAAVSHAMVQDPAAAQAQVELMKDTLKQMGLDPGRAGDVGCLAPQ